MSIKSQYELRLVLRSQVGVDMAGNRGSAFSLQFVGHQSYALLLFRHDHKSLNSAEMYR